MMILYMLSITLGDNIQTLVLAGKFGNQPGCLKTLDNLKVSDLRKELYTDKRGSDTRHIEASTFVYTQ